MTERPVNAKLAASNAVPGPETASFSGWPVILYFHHVHPDIQHYTSLHPDEFAHAMALLKTTFEPVAPQSMPDLVAMPPQGTNSCLITFDDGYRDTYRNAVPLLEKFGWRAIFFVISDRVGTVEDHPVRGKIEYMTWEDLSDLVARGHVVASHGRAHLNYREIPSEIAQADLDEAARCLDSKMAEARRWFAFPYGEIPDYSLNLPSLTFGTVKSPARPWSEPRQPLRRTYLPTHEMNRWPMLIEGWRKACGSA